MLDTATLLRSWTTPCLPVGSTAWTRSQWGGSTCGRIPRTPADMDAMLREGQQQPPARRCWMACHEGHSTLPVGHAQLADWRDGNARLGRVVIALMPVGRAWLDPCRRDDRRGFQHAGNRTPGAECLHVQQAAIRTHEALGFTLEGVRRSATRAGEARWDTGMMGLPRRPSGARRAPLTPPTGVRIPPWLGTRERCALRLAALDMPRVSAPPPGQHDCGPTGFDCPARRQAEVFTIALLATTCTSTGRSPAFPMATDRPGSPRKAGRSASSARARRCS